MRKNSLLLLLVLILVQSLYSQEMLNISNTLYLHNPAVTGLRSDLNLTAQHFGFDLGLPDISKGIQSFNNSRIKLDGRIPLFEKLNQLNLNAGIAYERDEYNSVSNENNWSVLASNFFKLKNGSLFSLGFSYTQRRIGIDESYLVFVQSPEMIETKKLDRFSTGLFYENEDRTFIAGLGASREGIEKPFSRINMSLGKAFKIGSKSALSINTFNEYRMTEGFFRIEVPVKYHFNKWIYAGGVYSSFQYVGLLCGGSIKTDKAGEFGLNLGYTQSLSKLTNRNVNGLQFSLIYDFIRSDTQQVKSYF